MRKINFPVLRCLSPADVPDWGPYELVDPQQRPFHICPQCGGEAYDPDEELCYECREASRIL